jgi:hypothetical protein
MSSIAFDHIALGMPRIADAVPFLAGVLGGVPHSGMQGGPEFRFGTWRYDTVDRQGSTAAARSKSSNRSAPTASCIAFSRRAGPASIT